MRVAVTSDTQGRQNWVMLLCDVFVHAGDITGRGSMEETACNEEYVLVNHPKIIELSS